MFLEKGIQSPSDVVLLVPFGGAVASSIDGVFVTFAEGVCRANSRSGVGGGDGGRVLVGSLGCAQGGLLFGPGCSLALWLWLRWLSIARLNWGGNGCRRRGLAGRNEWGRQSLLAACTRAWAHASEAGLKFGELVCCRLGVRGRTRGLAYLALLVAPGVRGLFRANTEGWDRHARTSQSIDGSLIYPVACTGWCGWLSSGNRLVGWRWRRVDHGRRSRCRHCRLSGR
jgi:hypothetical protein